MRSLIWPAFVVIVIGGFILGAIFFFFDLFIHAL